jgi:hypothetical protein
MRARGAAGRRPHAYGQSFNPGEKRSGFYAFRSTSYTVRVTGLPLPFASVLSEKALNLGPSVSDRCAARALQLSATAPHIVRAKPSGRESEEREMMLEAARADATRPSGIREATDATGRPRRHARLAPARQPATSRTSAPAVPARTGAAYGRPERPVGATPPRRLSPIRPIAALIPRHLRQTRRNSISQFECQEARPQHIVVMSSNCMRS